MNNKQKKKVIWNQHYIIVLSLKIKNALLTKWLEYVLINVAVVLRGKILAIYVRSNIMILKNG